MKIEIEKQILTFVSENDQDVFALGRLAQKTRTKATKYPTGQYQLELPVADLMDVLFQ